MEHFEGCNQSNQTQMLPEIHWFSAGSLTSNVTFTQHSWDQMRYLIKKKKNTPDITCQVTSCQLIYFASEFQIKRIYGN